MKASALCAIKTMVFADAEIGTQVTNCFLVVDDVLTRLRRERGSDTPITVLDLAAGKGGDLQKWRKGRISRLVCAGAPSGYRRLLCIDIASSSLSARGVLENPFCGKGQKTPNLSKSEWNAALRRVLLLMRQTGVNSSPSNGETSSLQNRTLLSESCGDV